MLQIESIEKPAGDLPDPVAFVSAHWDDVLCVLEEQWLALKKAKGRYPKGPRTTPERAEELFKRVHLQLVSLVKGKEVPPPELLFLPFGKRLTRSVLVFSLIVSCVVGFLFCVVIIAHARGFLSLRETGLLALSACSLLYLPFPVYRRTRINMEHNCRYIRDGRKGYVVIGDVREGLFISFCAHEMAHHFLREKEGGGGPWEEGWARWIQFKISEALSRECNVDALTPVLTLLVGELKEALMLTKGDRAVPGWVRRVRSPFHTSPFVRWVRGEPGYSKESLSVHALGTAAFALLVRGDGALGY